MRYNLGQQLDMIFDTDKGILEIYGKGENTPSPSAGPLATREWFYIVKIKAKALWREQYKKKPHQIPKKEKLYPKNVDNTKIK